VWKLDVGAPVVALTLVGNLLIASTHAALVAVDARSGAASWTTESQDVRWTAPSLTGGALVVTGTDLKLTAVNLADGTVRWRHDAASYNAAPAVVGSSVVVASRDKRVQLLALDALDHLYEYEGAKREILAAARADLDAEEAAAASRKSSPESEAAEEVAATASEPAPEPEPTDVAASDEEIPPTSETPVAAEETGGAVEPEEAVPDATAAEPEPVEEAAPDDAATRADDAAAAPSPPEEEAPSEGGL
jgi:chemotaxis protein histidine kinase CheA